MFSLNTLTFCVFPKTSWNRCSWRQTLSSSAKYLFYATESKKNCVYDNTWWYKASNSYCLFIVGFLFLANGSLLVPILLMTVGWYLFGHALDDSLHPHTAQSFLSWTKRRQSTPRWNLHFHLKGTEKWNELGKILNQSLSPSWQWASDPSSYCRL